MAAWGKGLGCFQGGLTNGGIVVGGEGEDKAAVRKDPRACEYNIETYRTKGLAKRRANLDLFQILKRASHYSTLVETVLNGQLQC